MTGLERNFRFYAGQATVRLRDEMHNLSEKTKFNIRNEATSIARDLIKEVGLNKNGSAKNITAENIQSVVQSWQERGLAVGTIQNKMTVFRQILSAAQNKISISNAQLGINSGRDVLNSANVDKSCRLSAAQLLKIDQLSDKTIAGAIKLSAAYGLRRDESLRVVHALTLNHSVTVGDNKLNIKAGWGKGSRPRVFEMRDGGQTLRTVAQEVRGLKIKGRIENFRNRFENVVKKLDIKPHGLRHAYIQDRYKDISNMTAPSAGGLKYAEMSDKQREIYHNACKAISPEIGHTRESIIRTYVGK